MCPSAHTLTYIRMFECTFYWTWTLVSLLRINGIHCNETNPHYLFNCQSHCHISTWQWCLFFVCVMDWWTERERKREKETNALEKVEKETELSCVHLSSLAILLICSMPVLCRLTVSGWWKLYLYCCFCHMLARRHQQQYGYSSIESMCHCNFILSYC